MTDWTGKQISHYRIVNRLGQGGMGVVYLAEDMNIGRRVVLKLLKSDLAADPHMEERFHREARASAAVSHPNITTVFEVNRHEGIWYICMEYIEGETLRSILGRRGSLPPAEAVRLGVAVAEALGVAHEAGIVHRDMKPENIMVTTGGQVKVLDFGLAVFTNPLRQPLDIASMDTAVSLTGMEYGGITPIGLPADWPILVDQNVADQQRVIIGSGIRGSKLLASSEVLAGLPGAEVLGITKSG